MLENRFNFEKLEKEIYDAWIKAGIFKTDVSKASDNPEENFCVMMPPPNVTGVAHLGHAMDNSIQDVLVRYNRMKGKNVLWQAGLDHAGIMTQMVVEKQMDKEGISRYDLGREKFLQRVWDWKKYSGGMIINQFKALGISPDWDRERFTMDEGLSKAVLQFFVNLYKEGLIYKGLRLINWDIRLQTAVSDLEVESKEETHYMHYIRYALKDSKDDYIVIATTRPETIFVDVAIAIHPENEKLKHLIGKTAIIPISNKEIPIIADEYADPEKGTGAVKITPAHDFNDYEVGKRHNLEAISVFDLNAKLNENAPEKYQGMDRFDARKAVVSDLEQMGILEKIEKTKSVIPYGERSGTIIEPMMTEQWFVDTKTLIEKYGAIDVVKKDIVKFIPKYRENIYFHFMENIEPWCISRSLWWGHQIPVWYGPDGKMFCEISEEEAIKSASKEYGKEISKSDLTRDENVLDTWFSSALWPFATLGWPNTESPDLKKFYPNTILITGFDIIFYWVARMIMAGTYCMNKVPPFKHIFIHGLMRDSKGQKMSKSKGNGIDPMDMIKQYSADALRAYLVSQTKPGADVKFNEKQLEGWRDFSTKIYNATKFLERYDILKAKDLSKNDIINDFHNLTDINVWILEKLNKCIKSIDTAIKDYRLSESIMYIYEFIWSDFCSWYIEALKVILTDTENESEKEQTKQIAKYTFKKALQLLHPYMPFITEHLWQEIGDTEYKFIASSILPSEIDDSLFENYKKANKTLTNDTFEIIEQIRSFKSNIGLASQIIDCKINNEFISNSKIAKKMISNLGRVNICENTDKQSVDLPIKDGTISFIKIDSVDWQKVNEMLKSELENKTKYLNGIKSKLSNEGFINNADKDLIEDMKLKEQSTIILIEKLEIILKQF